MSELRKPLEMLNLLYSLD